LSKLYSLPKLARFLRRSVELSDLQRPVTYYHPHRASIAKMVLFSVPVVSVSGYVRVRVWVTLEPFEISS